MGCTSLLGCTLRDDITPITSTYTVCLVHLNSMSKDEDKKRLKAALPKIAKSRNELGVSCYYSSILTEEFNPDITPNSVILY